MLPESIDGIRYPLEFRWMLAHGFVGLTPWHVLETEDQVRNLRNEFQRETATPHHTIRDILPFASRQDMDDIAGFIVENGVVTSRVVITHLTRRGGPELPGFPGIERFDTFWQWLRVCVEETVEWCDENYLADITSDE